MSIVIENDTTVPVTTEEKKELTRMFEDDILGGLLAAAGYADNDAEIKEFNVVRNGGVVLVLHFRPVSELENDKCRKNNSTYKKNKVTGAKTMIDRDQTRYRSELIYMATTDEDKEKIWNNKEAWKKLNVLNGIDMIDYVLKAGEKERAIEIISEISGFGEDLEETAKN